MKDELPTLPVRAVDAHKGSFGTCLLVGGSAGMMGALVLAGRAALRSGVGLVRLGAPSSRQQLLPIAVPEATSIALPERLGALSLEAVTAVVEAARGANATGLGPGLSGDAEVRTFVVESVPRIEGPLVLDADGLNALAGRAELVAARKWPTVLTPHPGEAARLLGWTGAGEVQRDRLAAADELARRTGAVVVLKGAGTWVVGGSRRWQNHTGNPGMATGGSGDVLTGVLTALLAQGLDPFDATRLAVWAHGRAGDRVAAEASQAGLVAGDLVAALPQVWRELEQA